MTGGPALGAIGAGVDAGNAGSLDATAAANVLAGAAVLEALLVALRSAIAPAPVATVFRAGLAADGESFAARAGVAAARAADDDSCGAAAAGGFADMAGCTFATTGKGGGAAGAVFVAAGAICGACALG